MYIYTLAEYDYAKKYAKNEKKPGGVNLRALLAVMVGLGGLEPLTSSMSTSWSL